MKTQIIERSQTLKHLQALSDRLSIGKRPTIVAYVVITVVVSLLYARVIVRPNEIIFGGDIINLHYVFEDYVTTSLQSGYLPHWNPYLLSGYPALAHPQYLVFYPPQMLLRFLPANQSISWAIILHTWVAGMGMYALARRFKMHPWIALACGLTFALNGGLIMKIWAGHVWLIYAMAWIPLAWLLITIALEDRSLSAIVGAGAVVALILLTGHPTFPAYILTFFCLYVGYLVIRTWSDEKDRRSALQTCLRFAAIIMLAVGFSAVQIVPTAVLAPHTSLSGGYDLAGANYLALRPPELLTFLVPNLLGDTSTEHRWEWVTYLGILTLLAAPYAFTRKQTRPLAWLLTSIFALSIILAFGKSAGLYSILYRLIPPFRILRIPPRSLVMGIPAVIVLGGLGLQALLEGAPEEVQVEIGLFAYRNLASFCLGALSGFVLNWLFKIPASSLNHNLLLGFVMLGILISIAAWRFHQLAWFRGWPSALLFGAVGLLTGRSVYVTSEVAFSIIAHGITVAILMMGASLLLIPVLWRRKLPGAAALLVVLVVLFDMLVYGARYITVYELHPTLDEVLDSIPSAYEGRFHEVSELPNYNRNWSMLSEFGIIDGYDSLWLSNYSAYMDAAGPNRRAVDFLNVTHFLSYEALEFPNFEVLAEGPDYVLYRNLDALPRAFWVSDAQVVDGPEQAAEALRDPAFSYAETVVLYEDVEIGSEPEEEAVVEVIGFNAQNGQIVVETLTFEPGVLVLSEPHYVERHAWLDGEEVPVLIANIAFSAISLPAGQHIVELRYVPTAFYLGLGITIATIIVGLGLILFSRRTVR